jgi:ribosomal protein S18 acetylase RimI-like enzyme
MADDITVRKAEAGDLEGAAELAAHLVRQHHEVDPGRFFLPERVEQGYASWFRHELGRAGAVILVATRGAALVGYAYGALEGRDWNLLLDEHGAIHDIFVVSGERQHGVGRRLLDAILRELEALGAQRIILSTMVSNVGAQRLFASVGFRPTLYEMTRGG